MAHVTVNGVRLHVQQLPAKPNPGRAATVVFVHGLGTDSLASFYFTLAGPVSAAGIDVVAYDLRGHGRSDRPPTGYRLADAVADLSGLLDALDVGPVHLVGNSYGGTVAFSYAVQDPERVASVVMIESEPATEPWAQKMADLLGRAFDQLGDGEALAWIAEHRGAHTARLAKAASETLHATTMVGDIPSGPLLSREQVRSVRCPVLAVFGAESDLVDQAEVFEAELPCCRVVVVAGQEHSVLVEAPRVVCDLVLGWLAGHGRSAGHDDASLSRQAGWG